jgi:hypothetical protein
MANAIRVCESEDLHDCDSETIKQMKCNQIGHKGRYREEIGWVPPTLVDVRHFHALRLPMYFPSESSRVLEPNSYKTYSTTVALSMYTVCKTNFDACMNAHARWIYRWTGTWFNWGRQRDNSGWWINWIRLETKRPQTHIDQLADAWHDNNLNWNGRSWRCILEDVEMGQ